MSLWGVHAGFGMLVATLVVAWVGWGRWRRWAVIWLSGFWAVIPDLYHFVAGTRAWYKPLVHDSLLADLFWLHRVFDRVDPHDRMAYSAAVFGGFLVVFVVIEWRVGR